MEEKVPGAPRLLVVDDDPDVAAFVADVAAGLGFDAAVAGSAGAARERCRAAVPDVVILDLVLPAEGGVELLDFLGAECASAKVLLVTGLDAEVLDTAARIAEARGLGVAASLMKPLSLESLEAALAPLARPATQ